MGRIISDMTVAKVLDLNPLAAQILFRYGIRSFFSPAVANETIANLSKEYQFNLDQVLEDLNRLLPKTSEFFVHS